jgi:hypothetical protein
MKRTILSAPEFDTDRQKVPLNGTWKFSYDPAGAGERNRWFASEIKLPEKITVPGCSQTKYYRSSGMPSRKEVRVDGKVLPETFRDPYLKYPGITCPSWYKTTFMIPAAWRGKEIWLHAGGVKPSASFWVNGHWLGATVTSRSPVRCNLTRFVRPGSTNSLTVKISWPSSGLEGMYDWLIGWSGIYRGLWIETVPQVHLTDIHVISAINPPSVTVNVCLNRKCPAPERFRAVCEIKDNKSVVLFHGQANFKPGKNGVTAIKIPMPGACLWSPDTPRLYKANVYLFDGERRLDGGSVRFGLREVKTDGFKVLLNGNPVFLRGGCDDHLYPHTISPPPSKAFFLSRIKKAKQYGFNYTKSCIEIFTKEYLDAADELGYLVCQEMPFGRIRREPSPARANLFRRELKNIITSDRNHPSVILYSMASEVYASIQSRACFQLINQELPALTRKLNPRAIVYDVTSMYSTAVNTSWGRRDTDLLENHVPSAGTQCPLTGPIPDLGNVKLPFVLHEYCWWTALPDPRLAKRYNRLPIRPVGVPEMLDAARANGFSRQDVLDFVESSRKLKYVIRKDGLELARKHPKIAGYHHWLIHDFSYSPEGVLNEFWEEPADLDAEEFRCYNADTVLLLEDHDQRCFEYGQEILFGIKLSHFGGETLKHPVLKWSLRKGNGAIIHGSVSVGTINCGSITELKKLCFKLPAGEPVKLILHCELINNGKRVCRNNWNLWMFPRPDGGKWQENISTNMRLLADKYPRMKYLKNVSWLPDKTGVLVTNELSGAAMDLMGEGGKVLLFSRGIFRESEGNLYRTVAYNCGRRGNMGTIIRPHPALGKFPHEGWCDLPFVPLLDGIYPMDLSTLRCFRMNHANGELIKSPDNRPRRLDPLMRSIGHYLTMEDKGYLFEVGVSRGALLACSLKLEAAYESSPAARYLVEQMLRYLATRMRVPKLGITQKQLRDAISKAPPETAAVDP